MLIFWILCIILCAVLGSSKGYSVWVCIVAGALGSLLAVLVLFLLPDQNQEAAGKRAGAPCKDIRRPCRPIGRPRRLSRPDRGGRHLSPLRPPPEGQSGFLLRLWPAVSI